MITGFDDIPSLLAPMSMPIQKKVNRKNTYINDVELSIKKLNEFIDKINDKIVNRIQLVAQVYLEDYKQQVLEMKKQLRNLRDVLDQQMLKQRSNEKMFYLQEERDFFRGQVMKLNEDLSKMNKTNENLKYNLQEKTIESDNYKKIIFHLEKKIMRMNSDAIQMDQVAVQTQQQQAKKLQKMKGDLKQLKSTFYNSKSLIPNEHQTLVANPQANSPKYQKKYMTQSTNLFNIRSKSLKNINEKNEILKNINNKQPSKRQQILDQCIKQVKKKIFYRTLNSNQTNKFHFNEADKTPFSKFTKTDKQDLILSLVSNDKVLQEFYRFMTEDKESKQSIFRKSFKNLDEKFNKKQLNELKIEFNKKIFQIRNIN